MDVLIVYTLTPPGGMTAMIQDIMGKLQAEREPGKLLLFCTDTPSHENADALAGIESSGVPVYLSPHRAVRSLVHLQDYTHKPPAGP